MMKEELLDIEALLSQVGPPQGTVFQLNTDGTGFTVLHSFQYTDGGNPEPLVLSGGTLYGTTLYGFQGPSLGDGGVFALILQPTLNIALIPSSGFIMGRDRAFRRRTGCGCGSSRSSETLGR